MEENNNENASSTGYYNDNSEGFSARFSNKKIISLVIGFIVVVLIIVIALVFVLPRLKPKKAENVTLSYWGIWEDASVFSEITQEFTRQHPNIKIQYEKKDIKAQGKYIDRLNTRIQNGTGPDIFRFHNSWVPELIGSLLPLPSDVVDSSELESQYYSVIKNDLKVNGAYYGIPLHIDTLALFINTKIFQDAGVTSYPVTWDDLLTLDEQGKSILTKIAVKDAQGRIKTSPIALGTFDNISHASDIISLLFLQNSADLRDLDGVTMDNSSKALEWYTSFAKGEGKVWDDTMDNSKLAFAKGNLAMYFGYSWDIFDIKGLNPNINFVIVPVLKIPQKDRTIASYWVEGVSSKTKHSKEAFEFLQFLAKKETLEKLYSKQTKLRPFGELYPRKDMADLLKSDPLIAPFLEKADSADSTIFSSDTFDAGMVDSLDKYLGDAVRSIVSDSSSPQTAIETLAKGVDQVLGRYGR